MRYWLKTRLLVLNLAAVALLGAMVERGYVLPFLERDTSGISYGILVLLVIGLAMTAYRAWQIGGELDLVKESRRKPLSVDTAEALALRERIRLRGIGVLANTAVMLGLIGTVLGFYQAFAGVSQQADARNTEIMVRALIEGVSIALVTTAVGSVAALWLGANQAMLRSAADKLNVLKIEARINTGRL